MNDFSLATLFGQPLGQIVVTVIVAVIASALTVRIMAGRREQAEPPQAPAARPIEMPPPAEGALVAAISAAVYAVIGAHRIVYVAAVRPGSSWTAETRTQHHTSHAPHAHAPHH